MAHERLSTVAAHLTELSAAVDEVNVARKMVVPKFKLAGRVVGQDADASCPADAPGRSDETPAIRLADAAMLLRDPPLLHLLLHETVRCYS